MKWLDNSINQFSPQREMISFDCQTQQYVSAIPLFPSVLPHSHMLSSWPTFKTQEIVGNHFGIDRQRLNLLRDAVTEAETLATKMMENGIPQSTNSPQYLTATALEHLASMSVNPYHLDEGHSLPEQVFWISFSLCMLNPTIWMRSTWSYNAGGNQVGTIQTTSI